MKNITYIYILILLCTPFNKIIGQVKITGNINYPPEKYEEIIIDNSKQNIYYNYTYLIEPNYKHEIRSSITVLEVGTKLSKFTDLNTYKIDSLQKKFSLLNSIGVKEINQQVNIIREIGFKKNVFNYFQNNSLTVQSKVHSIKYEYKEETPNLNWQLTNETKTILNYKVRKAHVDYGGRKWIAWYSEQIPINLGPYIFGDLPGLILELHDDKENFHFIAVGLDNKKKAIYQRAEKKIVKTTKESFFKAEKNFHEKPELFVRGTVKGGANFKRIPYNPIELIN